MRTTSRETRDLRERNEARCERLLERSELLDLEGIDFDAAPSVELDPAVIDVLIYMRDVENFTTRYLDGFAGHPYTLGDPLIARFLPIWQEEEQAHADAIDQFLGAYCAGRGLDVPDVQDPPPSRPPVSERVLVNLSRPLGHVVAATHMAWGATNELLTLNGYRLLASSCGHPQLRELLRRIAAQEARHYGFYLLQSEMRLAESRIARRVVPRLLERTWTPVGVGEGFKTPVEFDRIFLHLTSVAGAEERLASMDATIARLPGCGHLRLFHDAAATSRRRLGQDVAPIDANWSRQPIRGAVLQAS